MPQRLKDKNTICISFLVLVSEVNESNLKTLSGFMSVHVRVLSFHTQSYSI